MRLLNLVVKNPFKIIHSCLLKLLKLGPRIMDKAENVKITQISNDANNKLGNIF